MMEDYKISLNKSTIIPVGLIVALMITVSAFVGSQSSRITKIEMNLELQSEVNLMQGRLIESMNTELRKVNSNLIKQQVLLGQIEKKLK
jgi:hypothetical protein